MSAHHPHDPEIVECRDCQCQFDLARQDYFDNQCPSCRSRGIDQPTVACSNPECDAELPYSEMHFSRRASPFDARTPGAVCPEHRDWAWKPSRGI